MRVSLTEDALPEWLNASVRAVWQDLQADGPLPEIHPCAMTGDSDFPGAYWVGLTTDPERGCSISGSCVSPDDSVAQILVTIADNMQNVVSEMPAAWGQARPRCRHHPHPMQPVVIDDEAWWICGVLNERLGRIGSLSQDAEARDEDDRDG